MSCFHLSLSHKRTYLSLVRAAASSRDVLPPIGGVTELRRVQQCWLNALLIHAQDKLGTQQHKTRKHV